MIDVYIEVGKTRAVACAWAWPGWCRYGKTVESAIEALLAAAPRYQVIAQQAGCTFDLPTHVVSTTLQGTANTDWAPTLITAQDTAPWTAADAQRAIAILRAAWAALDDVVATSSPTLRKGPRGGGRDRDAVAQHVTEAERAYARKIGVKEPAFLFVDQAAKEAFRTAIATTLSAANDGSLLAPNGWPAAYAVRRMAWHVIDHVWEIEDRQMAPASDA